MSHPIVACARGWLGTRFHHQGRIRKTGQHKGGVDCLGLLVGVAAEMDLRGADGRALALADRVDYPHRPDSAQLRKRLAEVLVEIPCGGIAEGDVVLLRVDDSPQHLAIITDLGMIHAYAPARAVVEHELDGWWRARMEAAFRVCGDFQ